MSQITSLPVGRGGIPHSNDNEISRPGLSVNNTPDVTPKSFTPKSYSVYEKILAKDFASYIDKFKEGCGEQSTKNFINIVVSSGDNYGLFLDSKATFTFKGHFFTNLKFYNLTHNGMILKGCTMLCEGEVIVWDKSCLYLANFEGITIYGEWRGGTSKFHDVGLERVNLKKSDINHVEFNKGDNGYLKEVALQSANLNHVAFIGHNEIQQYKIGDTDLSRAEVNYPILSFVFFSRNVTLTEGKWNRVMLDGPCDFSGLIWKNYQDNALNWHPAMFQNIEKLKKALCPEQGAVFTRTLQTMKVKNPRIVVDSFNQMVRIITQSPQAMNVCLTSNAIRRALITELRDPVYLQSAEIQAFRNTFLIHHYQCEPLRNDNVERDEAIKLLQTLPAHQKLQLQVVINQVSDENHNILNDLVNIRPFRGLISCAKLKAVRFPHIFLNEEAREIICLSKSDFEQLITSNALPKEPQLIRYHQGQEELPEMKPATPEVLANLRSKIPLFDSLWKRAEFSWGPTINFLFSHRTNLSAPENLKVFSICSYINALLNQRSVEKMSLTWDAELLGKVFSPYLGKDWEQHCENLVGRICTQFGTHASFSSFQLNQQKGIAAIALIKLLVNLSTSKYFGFEDKLAEGLLVPVYRLYSYANKVYPGLYTRTEKIGWDSALGGPGLEHKYNAQNFLSRIENFKLPNGQPVNKIIDEMYLLA